LLLLYIIIRYESIVFLVEVSVKQTSCWVGLVVCHVVIN